MYSPLENQLTCVGSNFNFRSFAALNSKQMTTNQSFSILLNSDTELSSLVSHWDNKMKASDSNHRLPARHLRPYKKSKYKIYWPGTVFLLLPIWRPFQRPYWTIEWVWPFDFRFFKAIFISNLNNTCVVAQCHILSIIRPRTGSYSWINFDFWHRFLFARPNAKIGDCTRQQRMAHWIET